MLAREVNARYEIGEPEADADSDTESAGVTQLVECNVANVVVAGSSPVSRLR